LGFCLPLSAKQLNPAKPSTVNGWLIKQSSRLQSEQESSVSSLGVMMPSENYKK